MIEYAQQKRADRYMRGVYRLSERGSNGNKVTTCAFQKQVYSATRNVTVMSTTNMILPVIIHVQSDIKCVDQSAELTVVNKMRPLSITFMEATCTKLSKVESGHYLDR